MKVNAGRMPVAGWPVTDLPLGPGDRAAQPFLPVWVLKNALQVYLFYKTGVFEIIILHNILVTAQRMPLPTDSLVPW